MISNTDWWQQKLRRQTKASWTRSMDGRKTELRCIARITTFFCTSSFYTKISTAFSFPVFFGTMRTLKFNERIYNISLTLKITLFRDTCTGCPNKFLTTLGLFSILLRSFLKQFEIIFGTIWDHFWNNLRPFLVSCSILDFLKSFYTIYKPILNNFVTAT